MPEPLDPTIPMNFPGKISNVIFDNANDLECRLNQAVEGSSFIEVKDFTNLLLDYVFDKLADRGLMDFDGDFTTLHYIIKSDARKSTFQNKMLKVKINEI